MNKTAIVESRNFNPGHLSHILANYKLFQDEGISPILLVHPSFQDMNIGGGFNVLTSLKWRRMGKIDWLVVWFPSLRAIFDIVLLRWLCGAKVIYVLHEPFESIKIYRRAGFGWGKTARVCMVGLVNYLLVLTSSKIVISSQKAASIFRKKYHLVKKPYAVVPLLYDDEARDTKWELRRPYISYIGTIAEDHAFNEFLTFVARSSEKRSFPGHQFLIATRSSLSASDRRLVADAMARGDLIVRDGRTLTNAEINEFYANSVVVWNAYKRSMQSGVLAKAYMFGTPVLVSTLNENEYFSDRVNGVLVKETYDFAELQAAVAEMIGKFDDYSRACRRQFLAVFYYKAQSRIFMEFASSD
jgi:glycosyltransferase involved in cell wall biosynthesis